LGNSASAVLRCVGERSDIQTVNTGINSPDGTCNLIFSVKNRMENISEGSVTY